MASPYFQEAYLIIHAGLNESFSAKLSAVNSTKRVVGSYILNLICSFQSTVFVIMKILVAEDEENIALQYKMILSKRSHDVTITKDGVECLEEYYRELEKLPTPQSLPHSRTKLPFDAVVLDYRMPKKDGMEVAREILAIQPKQRIMFASAYVADTLRESVKTLRQVVELLQKPFDINQFADLLEDKNIWKDLEQLNVKVKELKNSNPSHAEVTALLEGLRRLQKGRAWKPGAV